MEVTEELLRSIKHLQITQESFDLNKDKFIAELNADKYQKPYLIAFTFTKELYKEHGRTFDRILETGLNITLEDMQTFHSSLFDHVYVKALVFGNMMPNDAVQVKQKIDSILDFGVLRNPSLLDPNIKQIDVQLTLKRSALQMDVGFASNYEKIVIYTFFHKNKIVRFKL